MLKPNSDRVLNSLVCSPVTSRRDDLGTAGPQNQLGLHTGESLGPLDNWKSHVAHFYGICSTTNAIELC